MATGDLEVLDRGLGCPETIEELTMSMERSRNQSQEEKTKGDEKAGSREEMSSQVQGPPEEEQSPGPQRSPGPEQAPDRIREGSGERKSSREKAEKEPSDKGGSGKERGKTAPKSAPARKKSKVQAQPPGKSQPRTWGPVIDELPWGPITLNKCLALASVVAVLSMAFQVFQDVIDGEEEGPEATPALWDWPGGSALKDAGAKLPKPQDGVKASAPAQPPPETVLVKEAPPQELKPEGQEIGGQASPAPAPEAPILPEDPQPSAKAAKPEKWSWAPPPKKEEKARTKKGFREERAEPPWRERKEGGHGPRPRREESEEARSRSRPWEREREHRRSSRREDPKKAWEGPRNKREEQRGRQRREDGDRFYPKQKHREGKRRD